VDWGTQFGLEAAPMQAPAESGQYLGLLLLLAFFALFVAFAVVAMRKARRRRNEQFRETSVEELEARAEQSRLETPGPEAETATAASERLEEPAAARRAEARPTPAVDAALAKGLARTSSSFRERLAQIFGRHTKLDPSVADELEDLLLTSDVGVSMTARLIGAVRGDIAAGRLASADDVRRALRAHLLAAMKDASATDPFAPAEVRPRVILFVGVNGVGKTTTIGKVAALARARGRSVVLAAGDTFRAAAVEQLSIWAQRTSSHIVRGEEQADPASVVFKAIEHGQKTGADLVLCDTAGRLHTKTQLMDEIKKVKRTAGKARAGAPDEVWLVVDATTGQNALQQAREFHQTLGLTGVILTKLDGTAKGGVVVAIADALHVPVRFVGVGETAEDLRPFEPAAFVAAMLS
jgi:fused signal recognition particle receptor